MRILTFLLATCCLLPALVSAQANTVNEPGRNALLYAVAWKQTAAEYSALYYQGFNMARLHVAAALAEFQPGDKPLAIITDVDDTVLLAHAYWGSLIAEGKDFFDDPDWDDWVRANRPQPSPGALDFLRFCADNDVTVFYVTNRDQGENSVELALANLRSAGFPFADREHLSLLRETSNKETVQAQLQEQFDVVVKLGDNLNDFARKYYLSDVDSRIARMTEDRDRYGVDYVLFPNPTDGHWLRAIFGESEPAPTGPNRTRLQQAATRERWR